MRKLLLTTLCTSTFILTACDKKPNEITSTNPTGTATVTKTSFSQNNVADIKEDLDKIQTLANAKTQEALKFKDEVTRAVQTGEKSSLSAIGTKMEKYVEKFNQDLDHLKLKSTEVDTIRNKMKESNSLDLELIKAGSATQQDSTQIAQLEKKAIDLQQSLLTDMQEAQIKISVNEK